MGNLKELEYYKNHCEVLEYENEELKKKIQNLELKIVTDDKGLNEKSINAAKELLEKAAIAKKVYEDNLILMKQKLEEVDQLEKDLKLVRAKAEKRFNKAVNKEIKKIDKH